MEDLIIKWAKDRGLLDQDNNQPLRQLLKATEELGELCKAELESDKNGIIDGIGDVIVCLIIYAEQKNLSANGCLELAYEEIKNRKGKTVNGTFIKE